MAVVSCGSRRWCRAREPARYAATVSATAAPQGTRRTGDAPAARRSARRAAPTPRAPMWPRRSPVADTGADVLRRSSGSYRRAPTVGAACVGNGVRPEPRPRQGGERRARSLARDVQHPDLDREPARLGAHRPDPRARHRPPHAADVAAAVRAAGPARCDRPRPRPLLRRPGAERRRHRAGHDRPRPPARDRRRHGRRRRRRRRQPGHADARRPAARLVGAGAAGHAPGHDRRRDRRRRARQEPPHQGQLRQPRAVDGPGRRPTARSAR